jgi:DNA-directed RNA polymerase specialized sigma24 family protein
MPSESPTSPCLLERALHNEPAALSALVCVRKERVRAFVQSLLTEGVASELAPDVTTSMEELADQCARRSTRPPEQPVARQTLLRRWCIVYELCQALALLPREQRAAVILIELEALAIDQVAWLLALSEDETRERLATARCVLRRRLVCGRHERSVRGRIPLQALDAARAILKAALAPPLAMT